MRTHVVPVLCALLLAAGCGKDDPSDKNGSQNGDPNAMTNNNNIEPNNGDACDVIDCTAPDAQCVGTVLVSYSGDGTCTDGACDFGDVETQTDCADSGQECMGGACVDVDDLCAGVTCDPQVGLSCEGDEAVGSGDGTCNPATGMCEYPEIRTDCAAMGMACENGICVALGPQPAAGEFVVTEIMANPAAVNDDAGEWFEVQNVAARDLDPSELTIMDDDGDTFTLPAGMDLVGPGEYLVFGLNTDMATNGGVAVDVGYTGMNLSNGADEIVIVDANAVEIDRVAWDEAAGWIIPSGGSVQYGADNDVAVDDNNDPQFWCGGQMPYGDGDLGTPGADNGNCGPVTVTVYDLSDENAADHPAENAVVEVNGIVITGLDAAAGHAFAQDPAGGPYSGVYLSVGNVDASALAVGDVVDVVGAYEEPFDLVQITVTSITDTGNDQAATPVVVESRDLADAATADQWEGVLITVNEAGVTDIDAGFGEIGIDSNFFVNDLLGYTDFSTNAAECEIYASITGPLNFSFGNYKIEVRDANDVGASSMATATTDVAQSGLAFNPVNICITAGDTVTWTNMDALSHTVTERLASDSNPQTNIPATPLFDEVLNGNATATVTFADAGTYHYRCRPHPAMVGAVIVPDP